MLVRLVGVTVNVCSRGGSSPLPWRRRLPCRHGYGANLGDERGPVVSQGERDALPVQKRQPCGAKRRREYVEGWAMADHNAGRRERARLGDAGSDVIAASLRAVASRQLVDRVRHQVDEEHALDLQAREPGGLVVAGVSRRLVEQGVDDAAEQIVVLVESRVVEEPARCCAWIWGRLADQEDTDVAWPVCLAERCVPRWLTHERSQTAGATTA